MSVHKWEFSLRFRRHGFGWRSATPMKRIKEAISEIKKVSKKEPVIAAEGAILFLEKVSPALANVDSSSGSIGNAVYHAIEELVPIISNAVVTDKIRQKWMKQLWNAIEEDNIPYIEHLENYFGQLCVKLEIASHWADEFISLVKHIWSPEVSGFNFYKGVTPCLSALLFAKRYDELLALLENAPHKMWHYRKFGVDALIEQSKLEEALIYAQNSGALNCPYGQISQKCEEILILMGRNDEAYQRYAISANQAMTNLATFRAIVKKYPHKNPEEILHDLIQSVPGNEGKWFAAAKTAGFFDLAIKLVSKNPADPKTLARTVKEYADKKPDFAIEAGMASLRWINEGYGYEISGADVFMAFSAIMIATKNVGIDEAVMKEKIRQLIAKKPGSYVQEVLKYHLNT